MLGQLRSLFLHRLPFLLPLSNLVLRMSWASALAAGVHPFGGAPQCGLSFGLTPVKGAGLAFIAQPDPQVV